jgi:hypothetical protein
MLRTTEEQKEGKLSLANKEQFKEEEKSELALMNE